MGEKLLFKKYCEEERKGPTQEDSSGSNAGPAGVDYRHILPENSG